MKEKIKLILAFTAICLFLALGSRWGETYTLPIIVGIFWIIGIILIIIFVN